MNHLLRELAPISDAGWELLDGEARERLRPSLAARRLVDFTGPHGWQHSATNLGRIEAIDSPAADGVRAAQRQILPLVELRAEFTVARAELADNDRGAFDADLAELDAAAQRIAIAENVAVFHGWAKAGIAGIAEASPVAAQPLGDSAEGYPRSVARAVEALREVGVEGPYGLALGPDEYTRVIETAEHGGYPLFDHLAKILVGPIVWAPGVKGAVVLSLRGGDFCFESGQDLAIGYSHHDAETVHLYLEESFSFRVATPEAAAPLSS
ncbi:MAG TPA: family 1 encapsulin nanocompartment shell protein [Solirubrobacterales bacterium]|nr:family 1 encapsulin nanocompartment shell protein [Solirubrobacterales bacterium]